MFQDMVPSPPTKEVLRKVRHKPKDHMLRYVIIRIRCSARFSHWIFKETSPEWHLRLLRNAAFTSPSSSSRFLREQRHQCGTGPWHFLRSKELPRMVSQVRMKNRFLLSIPISTKSFSNVRSVHIDESARPFTLLEQIR